MNRLTTEKRYWDMAATDPLVEEKYICNLGGVEMVDDLGGRVLEIGCGVGRLLKPGWCGIDISQNMLDIAKKRKPECTYKVTDGRTIPFEDNSFDSAYCVLVFQHLPFSGVSSYIKEARRVLKQGGVFLFQYIEGYEDEPFSKHHSFEDLFTIIKENNFTIISHQSGLVHPSWTWIKLK